ncbi:MFS transporter [Streptomyces sp. NPDC046805]|uniref:MFS transporter n=1 Tax=Streptomyces sp. NPDC046805 TaxID=3155134 RepID=UPI0033D99C38
MSTSGGTRGGVLRNRDFSLLLSGQLVSSLGNQMQLFALPLVVLALSGTPTQAGLVMGLNTVSFLVFGLVAGALVDRWNRKVTMIWCEVGRGLLVLSVVVALWGDRLTMAHLYVVALATGVLGTFFQVADTAALPNVVAAEQLPAALGLFQSMSSTLRIVGASIAGALYGLGRVVPFLVDGLSFLVSAVSLRFVRAEFQQEREKAGERPALTLRALTEEIRHGVGWVGRQPVIRFLTFVQAADNLRYGAGYLVIIMLAKGVGADSTEIGLIFSGAAVGALVGSALSDRIIRRFPLGRIAVIAMGVVALAFPLYAVASDPLLLGVVAALESLVRPVCTVALTSYQLSITPDALQGRVTSAVSTLVFGAMSIGTLVGGALVSALGADRVVLLFSGWLLLLALLTAGNRTVRRAPRVGEARPVGGEAVADEGVSVTGSQAGRLDSAG